MKQPPERLHDITPIGWTYPSIEETPAVLRVIARLFYRDGLGFTMKREGIAVYVVELDGVPVAARVERARAELYGVRQQQLLEALHESGRYDEARAAMVLRAERAMKAARSRFTAEHPKEKTEDAPY